MWNIIASSLLSLALVFPASLVAAKPRQKIKRQLVEVAGVLSTQDGQFVVVLRTQVKPVRYLPIWIGEMEALNIRLRMQRQKPPRPLTLNLLESVLLSGNIKLTEIAIDGVQGGVFLGTIGLKQKGRNWRVDARPSDAIGLAIGNDAPIWVSNTVIETAAVDPRDFDGEAQPDSKPGGGKEAKTPPVNYEETL